MRDIRSDLQDRASLLEEQINAHEAQFDKIVEQLRVEHEGRLEDLKAEFAAVTKLMELEQRRIGNAPAPKAHAPQAPTPARAPIGAPAPVRAASVAASAASR